MKACRDCRHVHATPVRTECLHPEAAEWLPDYFTGSRSLYQPSIQIARTLGKCGPEAKLWEPCDAP